VDSLSEYQQVAAHGLNLLCALLQPGLTNGISLGSLVQMLYTKVCDFCGECGGFVFLLAGIAAVLRASKQPLKPKWKLSAEPSTSYTWQMPK
jgi:hypothetical protein